jgi:hypothetical protein
MRGGDGQKIYKMRIYYSNQDITNRNVELSKILDEPILRLTYTDNFNKNNGSFTLTFDFDLNVLNRISHYLDSHTIHVSYETMSIPKIINGLLNNTNFDFNSFNIGELATLKKVTDADNDNRQKYKPNIIQESMYSAEIKDQNGFIKKHCVITLEFEPNAQNTRVTLKSYTSIKPKGILKRDTLGWDINKVDETKMIVGHFDFSILLDGGIYITQLITLSNGATLKILFGQNSLDEYLKEATYHENEIAEYWAEKDRKKQEQADKDRRAKEASKKREEEELRKQLGNYVPEPSSQASTAAAAAATAAAAEQSRPREPRELPTQMQIENLKRYATANNVSVSFLESRGVTAHDQPKEFTIYNKSSW